MRLHFNTGWSGPVVHTWMTLSQSVEVPTVLSSLVRATVMSAELDCDGESCVCWGVVFTSDRILDIDSCMFVPCLVTSIVLSSVWSRGRGHPDFV